MPASRAARGLPRVFDLKVPATRSSASKAPKTILRNSAKRSLACLTISLNAGLKGIMVVEAQVGVLVNSRVVNSRDHVAVLKETTGDSDSEEAGKIYVKPTMKLVSPFGCLYPAQILAAEEKLEDA